MPGAAAKGSELSERIEGFVETLKRDHRGKYGAESPQDHPGGIPFTSLWLLKKSFLSQKETFWRRSASTVLCLTTCPPTSLPSLSPTLAGTHHPTSTA
ncbi:eukaryotic translation initiation factor 2B, subunit 2 beta, isoform CRA_c [Mus musculus]|nr:eukaryotic translation initiation factor 2B, subunit 2 beta, isoform CRA_c [Mus musculus]